MYTFFYINVSCALIKGLCEVGGRRSQFPATFDEAGTERRGKERRLTSLHPLGSHTHRWGPAGIRLNTACGTGSHVTR
jgi:hypothetical protein